MIFVSWWCCPFLKSDGRKKNSPQLFLSSLFNFCAVLFHILSVTWIKFMTSSCCCTAHFELCPLLKHTMTSPSQTEVEVSTFFLCVFLSSSLGYRCFFTHLFFCCFLRSNTGAIFKLSYFSLVYSDFKLLSIIEMEDQSALLCSIDLFDWRFDCTNWLMSPWPVFRRFTPLFAFLAVWKCASAQFSSYLLLCSSWPKSFDLPSFSVSPHICLFCFRPTSGPDHEAQLDPEHRAHR